MTEKWTYIIYVYGFYLSGTVISHKDINFYCGDNSVLLGSNNKLKQIGKIPL